MGVARLTSVQYICGDEAILRDDEGSPLSLGAAGMLPIPTQCTEQLWAAG